MLRRMEAPRKYVNIVLLVALCLLAKGALANESSSKAHKPPPRKMGATNTYSTTLAPVPAAVSLMYIA